MCIFTRPVQSVERTQIFARTYPDGRQSLVYSMKFSATEDTAMVLPVPVAPGDDEQRVEFVSLEGYPELFHDLTHCFGPPLRYPAGSKRPASRASRPRLVVHSVGAFEASFVPTQEDFSRLDPRFQLPPAVLSYQPDYQTFGFVVARLKAEPGATLAHPLAFLFPRRDTERIFYPTVHRHGATMASTATFDHELFFQGAVLDRTSPAWQKSTVLARTRVQIPRTEGLLNGASLWRRKLRGRHPNRDTWLDLRAPRATKA